MPVDKTKGGRRAAEPRRTGQGLPRDGDDPPLRGAGAGGILEGRNSGLRPSLCRRGGLGGRGVLASARRGLHRQHPSRARALDRQRLRPGLNDAGIVRQEGRAVRRQGRLDAHRRSRPRHARRQRHRRRRTAAGGRRRAQRQDLGPRHRRGLVHRRWRLEPGHHFRGDEHGGGAETAGDLRLRKQPVWRGHRVRLRRRQP